MSHDLAAAQLTRSAAYMSMAVTGGMHDHQLIMDFLPSQLFRNDERQVVEFMATGFSMGGA